MPMNLYIVVLLTCLVGNVISFKASEDVYYELYTRDLPLTVFHNLLVNNRSQSIAKSPFLHNVPTRIFVHGYRSKRKKFLKYAKAYREKGNFNFIVVNWLEGAQTINYYKARQRVPQIAEQLALFIDNLVQYKQLNLIDVILIGHSLGAHIAGIAAKRIHSGRIPIIVALDPAYPLFGESKRNEMLFYTDADYVQVIHTSIRLLSIPYPVGHADFYPNYGSGQPGCDNKRFLDLGFCSHSRAHDLFVESLNHNCFLATKCDSYKQIENKHCTSSGPSTLMGGEVEQLLKASKGIYYLPTNSVPSYGMNCSKLMVINKSETKSFRQRFEYALKSLKYEYVLYGAVFDWLDYNRLQSKFQLSILACLIELQLHQFDIPTRKVIESADGNSE